MATAILWLLLVPALCQVGSFHRIRRAGNCGNNKFECTSGTCIDSRKICDGTNDCSDASDETQTLCLNTYVPALTNFISKEILPLVETCPKGTFQCGIGGCLDLKVKCNGKEECLDGSDENLPECPITGCKNDEYRCQNKQCIPKSKHCNGIRECNDGSDETGCKATGLSNCVYPELPQHGTYSLFFCIDQPVPGQKAKHECLLQFSCNEGFEISSNKLLICMDTGKWSAPVPTCEPKKCPAIPTTSVTINCKNSFNIPCNMRLPVGTIADLKCKQYFYNDDRVFQRITCEADGLWSENPLSCKEECGNPIPQGNTLLNNGVPTRIGYFPWHVGIYFNTEDKFEQICGGSLISRKLVLTVAHCFWNKTRGEVVPESFFRIAAGKYHRAINTKDEKQQIRDVHKLRVHEEYRDSQGNYEADIAIVVVSIPFDISPVVQPVCIDWVEKFEIIPGRLGTVVGWGITEKQAASDVLLRIDVPFVDRVTCLRNLPADFQGYALRDKMCIGDLANGKGQTVCNGDSGGGYCYEAELSPLSESRKRYVIQGLVSIGVNKQLLTCNPENYALFTKVSTYLKWINATMLQY